MNLIHEACTDHGAMPDVWFQIFPLVGKESHDKVVTDGEYCLRTNQRGVDLNRNWDESWNAEVSSAETNPGPGAFSEWETELVRREISKFNPITFLSVHSGVKAMFRPYSHGPDESQDLAPFTFTEGTRLQRILTTMNPQFCDCSTGQAFNTVGYIAKGTSLDFAARELKVPYAFVVEV